jgi:two-component system sensor histidine kinase EvgS
MPDPGAAWDSTERHRSIVETAVDAIITIDERGRIESVNPAGERMFGWPAADIVGRNVRMLMPEPHSSRHDGYLGRYLRDGDPRIIGAGREVTGLRRDGTTFPMYLSVGEMRVGGRRMFTGIVRDVTDRVRAEERLRASEARHRAIVETAVDAIITISRRGIVDSFNTAAERIFGYRADEVIGRNVSMLMPEPDRSAHDGYLGRYLGGGEPRIIGKGREVTGRRKDGTTFPMHLAVSELIVDGERRFTGIVRDISELKRAQRELQAERDYADAVIASIQDGLVVRDLTGAIVQVNRRFCEMTGFAPEELVGTRAPFPYWPDDAGAAEAALAGEAGRGEADVRLRRRDGELIEAIVTVAPVRDAGGEQILEVETVKDVTERRRQQEALRETEARLQAQEESQRLKDEFVTLVSHELRTPLTSVMGYLELALEETELSADARRMVEVAMRNAGRLRSLVGDVLLLAREDAGRLTIDLREVRLEELLAGAVEGARPLAEAKGVTLAADLRPAPPILADADRLGQLMDNLLSNATKFTPPGGRVLVALSAGGGLARISVEDDGPGIPADEQERLFERFFRARRATEENVPGTGLGLAIAKSIAEGHGGRIGVTSAEGSGSTFWVELPLVPSVVIA